MRIKSRLRKLSEEWQHFMSLLRASKGGEIPRGFEPMPTPPSKPQPVVVIEPRPLGTWALFVRCTETIISTGMSGTLIFKTMPNLRLIREDYNSLEDAIADARHLLQQPKEYMAKEEVDKEKV